MEQSLPDRMEALCWRRNGWTATVVRSEEESGWAVQMARDGDPEPALVGPWTMGRDKKNPKPLDAAAFTTLVKAANEVLARHEQANQARLHRRWTYRRDDATHVRVQLDISPDEDDPHAILTCADEYSGAPLGAGRVPANFQLTRVAVEAFLAGREPG